MLALLFEGFVRQIDGMIRTLDHLSQDVGRDLGKVFRCLARRISARVVCLDLQKFTCSAIGIHSLVVIVSIVFVCYDIKLALSRTS